MMPSVLEEWPWAYVLLDSETMQYCHYCFRRCDDLLECSVCEFAVYCNSKCQKSAWPDHSGECFLIARTPYDLPNTLVRLISRVLIKINMQGLKSDILMTTTLTDYKKLNFEDLDSHYSEMSEDVTRTTNFAQCMHQLHMFMDAERLPTANRLMDIYGKISFNSMLILNNDLNPIGLGIYLTFSQFKHSCIPNSGVIFNGPTAILNYLSPDPPEKKGAATSYTISFGPIIGETELRRRHLYSNYYFICQCPRCTDENFDLIATSLSCKTDRCPGHVTFRQPNVAEMMRLAETSNSDSTELHSVAATCDVCGKNADNVWQSKILMINSNQENDVIMESEDMRIPCSEERYKALNELCAKLISDLHPLNAYLIRTKCVLTTVCLSRGLFGEALAHYEELLPAFRHYLPANHPTLALMELNAGTLQWRFKNWAAAKRHFIEAVKIMKFSHGKSHPLSKVAQQCISACDTAAKKGVRKNSASPDVQQTPTAKDQRRNNPQVSDRKP